MYHRANDRSTTDRIARAAGEKAATIPVVADDPSVPSALPTADSYKFFSEWEAKSAWKNEVTVRRYANPNVGMQTQVILLTLHQRRTPSRKRPFTHGPPHLAHPITNGRGRQRRALPYRHQSGNLLESSQAKGAAHASWRPFRCVHWALVQTECRWPGRVFEEDAVC
jgi:hypothetical protein